MKAFRDPAASKTDDAIAGVLIVFLTNFKSKTYLLLLKRNR
jgi:hypothetical protein